jgi:2-amino-4-hydroxy-6-hydroxymethyldihydropteridine diphosphokinase
MILLALGANLPSSAGLPAETLRAALAAFENAGVHIRVTSKLFVSAAWPDPRDPAFVNAVAAVETTLPPDALLKLLHKIEDAFGRRRGERNAPRTLDLDLLDYDGRVEEGPPRLPHPRMSERGFVLVPLADIAPQWRHPVSGRTVQSLIAELSQDGRNVRELEP